MKKILFTIATAALLLSGCGAKGEEQKQSGEPKIVATTMALVDTADQLNIDLVGIPSTSKEIPAKYKKVTQIGQVKKPNMEIVQSLQPTNILSVTSIKPEMEKALNGSKVKATYYNYNSIEKMQKSITQMGEDFNRKEEAKKLNARYDAKIKEIQTKVKGKKKPKVLVLLGVPGSYMISTEHSFFGNLVELAGGENVVKAKHSDEEFIASNTEHLYKLQPDIILRASHGFPNQVKAMFDEEFKTNTIWRNFKATKNNCVFDLDETLFGITANINADQSLEKMYQLLYEEK